MVRFIYTVKIRSQRARIWKLPSIGGQGQPPRRLVKGGPQLELLLLLFSFLMADILAYHVRIQANTIDAVGPSPKSGCPSSVRLPFQPSQQTGITHHVALSVSHRMGSKPAAHCDLLAFEVAATTRLQG